MLSILYKIFFRDSSEDPDNLGPAEMTEKIQKMENKITHLEEQNNDLQKQLDYNRNKEAALQKILCNYDNLLKKVIIEKTSSQHQQDTAIHLANLESAFFDLLQKYEKAKLVVEGYQKNESVLKKQVEEYENILDNLRGKFLLYQTGKREECELERRLANTKLNKRCSLK